MAQKKNCPYQILIKQFILLLCLVSTAKALDADFKNITSFNDVRVIKNINDTTYFLTSGGILRISDFNSPGKSLLNNDGLGTTNLFDIIIDSNNQLWVAGFGRLIRFDDNLSVQTLFRDRDDNLIGLYTLEDDADFIWVGTDRGLVLFAKNIDGGQIQDSYELFGDFNSSPRVLDIVISSDTIWIATSNGIAYSDKSDFNQLKSPINWKTFSRTDYPKLNSDTVNSIEIINGKIYAATNRAIVQIDISGDSLISLPFNGLTYARLTKNNDSLYYFVNDSSGGSMGVIIDNQTLIPGSISGLPSYPKVGLNGSSISWLADGSGGIYYSTSGNYIKYLYTGLLSNNVSDVSFVVLGADTLLTAGFREKNAAFLDNQEWNSLDLFRAGTKLMTDKSGDCWFGTEGEGLWRLGEGTFVNYDENNSTLLGNTDNPPFGLSFVYIRGLVTDGNYLYAGCYRAANGYPIAIADLNDLDNRSAWDSLGTADSIVNAFVVDLDVYGSQIAIGMETVGLYLYDFGKGHYDHSDDSVHLYTTSDGFLISNSIRKVKFSPDGVLWVGTNFGISRYDFGLEFFVDVPLPEGISSDITALEFDGRGNLWVGTVDGLAFWNATRSEFQIFNTTNSSLVSDKINDIHFEKHSGNLYVATTAGISSLLSYIGKPTAEIARVIAFPNPFLISNGNDFLSFNYSKAATVRLYTISGQLVNEFPVNLSWNGKNSFGNDVASGVYLFIITDKSGETAQGKFLLVR